MPSPRQFIPLVVAVVTMLVVTRAGAQAGTSSAQVAVTLRVLPRTSFEEPERPAAVAAPEDTPREGVVARTRVSRDATAQISVTAAPLRDAAGAPFALRFRCASGGGPGSAAAAFDCARGLVVSRGREPAAAVPLTVAAERWPDGAAGRYAALVTMTATLPAH